MDEFCYKELEIIPNIYNLLINFCSKYKKFRVGYYFIDTSYNRFHHLKEIIKPVDINELIDEEQMGGGLKTQFDRFIKESWPIVLESGHFSIIGWIQGEPFKKDTSVSIEISNILMIKGVPFNFTIYYNDMEINLSPFGIEVIKKDKN